MTQNPFEALGGGGEPGGFDLEGLLQQAQQMQQQLESAQERLARGADRRHGRGRCGSPVTVNGIGELQAVTIKTGGFDGSSDDDLSDLGDLIVAAYRDAKSQADALADQRHRPARGRGHAGPRRPRSRRRPGRARLLTGRLKSGYEGIVQDLIDELGRLPGVGPKGAQRIAFHLLQAEPADVRRLAEVLLEVKLRVKFCAICFNVSEEDECRICRDPRRDQTVLCVVEEYKDVVAIERTKEFRGRYHVLGGPGTSALGIGWQASS